MKTAPPSASPSPPRPVDFVSLTHPELPEADAQTERMLMAELRTVIESHLPQLEACISASASGAGAGPVQVTFLLDRPYNDWEGPDGIGFVVEKVSGPVDERCVTLTLLPWELPRAFRWEFFRGVPFTLVYDWQPTEALAARVRGEIAKAYRRMCIEFPWSTLTSPPTLFAAYSAIRGEQPVVLRARLDGMVKAVMHASSEDLGIIVAATFTEMGEELGLEGCPETARLVPR